MSNLEYIRDSKKPIYISTEVMRWLWLLQKAHPDKVSPDSIADTILRQTLEPRFADAKKKFDALEKEIIESLKQ